MQFKGSAQFLHFYVGLLCIRVLFPPDENQRALGRYAFDEQPERKEVRLILIVFTVLPGSTREK